MFVPFFKTPNVDGMDSLMAFDREMAKLNPIFVRDAVVWCDAPPDYHGGPHAIVVREIRPGVRVRHSLDIVWPENVQGQNVFLPDAWFEANPLPVI
jgi:hypothetical protein